MTLSKHTREWEPTNYHSITRGIYSDWEYHRRNKQLTDEEKSAILKEEAGLQKEARRSLEKHET